MIPGLFNVHTAVVEPLTGTGAYGDVYGEPYDVRGYYEGTRQLVRGSDGSEVVSEGTFYCDLLPDPGIPPGSKVTVAGRVTYVLTVSTFDDGGLTGLAHLEVALA